jgi:hypothetical protein
MLSRTRLVRPEDELGPLSGRFDGVTFMPHYFDGTRGAALELGPHKDGGLDVVLREPGKDVRKRKAIRTKKGP